MTPLPGSPPRVIGGTIQPPGKIRGVNPSRLAGSLEGIWHGRKFPAKEDGAGKYHFVFKAGNGEIISTSESYPKGKSNAVGAKIDEGTGQ